METSESIQYWVFEYIFKNGLTPIFPGWPKNLFNRPYDKIIDYISSRYQKTEDRIEYYFCIPYLTNIIVPDELFVPWEDSPNYQRLMGKNNTPSTNIATPYTPFEEIGSSIEQIGSSIEIVGGKK